MDQEKVIEETATDVLSIVSGSSENSRYDVTNNAIPIITAGMKPNYDMSNLSPIIPMQNIWSSSLFRKDNDVFHKAFQSSPTHSFLNHFTNQMNHDETSEKKKTEYSKEKHELVTHADHNICRSLKSHGNMGIFEDNKGHDDYEYMVYCTPGHDSTTLEHTRQEDQTVMEDSQVDLFESDDPSQQQQSHGAFSSRRNMIIHSKADIANTCNASQRTSLELKIDNCISQSQVSESASNKGKELFEVLTVDCTQSTNCDSSFSSKYYDQNQENMDTKIKHNSLQIAIPFVPNILACKADIDIGPNVDDVTSVISSCTIPPSITPHKDQLSVKCNNTNSREEQNILPVPSKTLTDDLLTKDMFLRETESTASDISVSIMVPETIHNKSKFPTSMAESASVSQHECKNSHILNGSNCVKPNQVFINKENLICEGQKNKNDASYLSQETKCSSDLFLSSLEATKKTSQDLSMSQSSKSKNNDLCASSGVLLKNNREKKKERRKESLSPVNKLQHPNDKEESREEPCVRGIEKSKSIHESVSRNARYEDLINTEHEKKFSCLKRFENLCNQIISRLGNPSGSPNKMEFYIRRCEYLITKMHNMQKEEKTKLCSSLEVVGINKQKRKMLKRQLEQLKSRHQTLMDIVHKYGKIKNKVHTGGNEMNLKSLSSQEVSTLEQSRCVLKPSMDKTESNIQSALCSVVENVEQKDTQQNPQDQATPVEGMEDTQCANISQAYSECCTASDPSSSDKGQKRGLTIGAMQVKRNKVISLDNCDVGNVEFNCGVNKDNNSTPEPTVSTAIVNPLGNVKRSLSNFDNHPFLGDAKNVTSSTSNTVHVQSNQRTHHINTTVGHPNKRKSSLAFQPPAMKEISTAMTSNSIESGGNSDALDIPDTTNRHAIPVNLAKEGARLSNNFQSSSCEGTSVYVDDILFTEFQDASSEMSKTADVQECVSIQNVNVGNSKIKTSDLDIPKKATVSYTVDNIVFTEFPQAPSTKKAVITELNQPTVCKKGNEIKEYTVSDAAIDSSSDKIISNTYSKSTKIGTVSQLIPQNLTYKKNTVTSNNIYNCIDLTTESPKLNALNSEMNSADKASPGVGKHSLSQIATDSNKENLKSGLEISEKTRLQLQLHVKSKIHLTCDTIQETKTKCPSHKEKCISKEPSRLPASVMSPAAVPSYQTYNNDATEIPYSYTCHRNLPVNSTLESNSKQSQQKTSGSPSPFSTQGSSLIPVSSREIDRCIQSQIPLLSTPTPVNIPVSSISTTATQNSNTIITEHQTDDLTLPTKLPEEESYSRQSLQNPTGPPSPCSTQGSSLFPVSSREILKRVQNRQQPPQIPTPVTVTPSNTSISSSIPSTQPFHAIKKPKFPHSSIHIKNVPLIPTVDTKSVSLHTSTQHVTCLQPIPTCPQSISNNKGIKMSQAENSTIPNYPKLIPNTISATHEVQQNPKTNPNVSYRLNLEPKVVSLNTIMTSSLCKPQEQNSSTSRDVVKVKAKPKFSRKRKLLSVSQCTQTSPDKTGVSFAEKGTENTAMNNTSDIELAKFPYKGKSVSFCSDSNAATTCECHDNSFIFRESIKSHGNSTLCSIVNNLRTVKLISDQELIPPNKGGIPNEFWDVDFACITMSKSTWDSVVDW